MARGRRKGEDGGEDQGDELEPTTTETEDSSSRGRRRRPTTKRAAMDAGKPRKSKDDEEDDETDEEEQKELEDPEAPVGGGDVVMAVLTDDNAADPNTAPKKRRKASNTAAPDMNNMVVASTGPAAFQPMSMLTGTSSSTSFSPFSIPPSNANPAAVIQVTSTGADGTAAGTPLAGTPILAGMVGGSLALNPLPTLSPSGAEPKNKRKAPASYSRKDKSLGLLCENFLKLYEGSRDSYISLDTAANSLGVERRRLYDIVNILESVDLVSRRGKNEYTWHGFTRLANALQVLYEQAKWEQANGITDIFNPDKLNLNAAKTSSNVASTSSSSAIPAVIPELTSSVSDVQNVTDQSGGPTIASVPAGGDLKRSRSARKSGDARREKSLGLLSQKFVQMFLMSDNRTISLELAARALLSDDAGVPFTPEDQQKSSFKSRVRRLYDIANVLCSLGLIEKVHIMQTRKPAFRWVGVLPTGLAPMGASNSMGFNMLSNMVGGGMPILMPLMNFGSNGSSSSSSSGASSSSSSGKGMMPMPMVMKAGGPSGNGLSFAFVPLKLPGGMAGTSGTSSSSSSSFMPLVIPMPSGSSSSSSSGAAAANPFFMMGQPGANANLSPAEQQKLHETMQSVMSQYQNLVEQWQQQSAETGASGGDTGAQSDSIAPDTQS